jgi:hypothetical protein
VEFGAHHPADKALLQLTAALRPFECRFFLAAFLNQKNDY